MSPSDLNDAARLLLVAKRCGAQLFDNAKSFDSVFGRGQFAKLDGEVLDMVRRIIKPERNGRLKG